MENPKCATKGMLQWVEWEVGIREKRGIGSEHARGSGTGQTLFFLLAGEGPPILLPILGLPTSPVLCIKVSNCCKILAAPGLVATFSDIGERKAEAGSRIVLI